MRLRRELDEAGRVRRRQLEIIAVIAAQCGLAAAISWQIAHQVLHVPAPVFAPTAAVGTIVAALGQQARRTAELLIGVAVGILISDVLLYLIGYGAWQTGVVVAFAIGFALLMTGRSGALVAQAGSSAVLVSTLSHAAFAIQWRRIEEAVIGGAVGLVVVGLLLPINPMRILDQSAAPIVEVTAAQLDEVVRAMAERDTGRAVRARERLRELEPDLVRMHEAMNGAEEVVTIAPARWRRRHDVERYRHAVDHVDSVVLECRELARWAANGLESGEWFPAALADGVRGLAAAIRATRRTGRRGAQMDQVRHAACEVARLAGRAASHADLGQYGQGILTQLLTIASDLIRGSGLDPESANRMVRRATEIP